MSGEPINTILSTCSKIIFSLSNVKVSLAGSDKSWTTLVTAFDNAVPFFTKCKSKVAAALVLLLQTNIFVIA